MKPRFREARQQAQAILAKFNIKEPPVDTYEIAKRLQIDVVDYPAPDDSLSGFVLRKDDKTGRPLIAVNEVHSEVRRRFTVAHELGHLFLHQLGSGLHVDQTLIAFRNHISETATDEREIEANQFAAELLMPTDWLKKEIQNAGVDLMNESLISNFAKRYNVSIPAMSIRLAKLGVISM